MSDRGKELGIPARPEDSICTCRHHFFLHRKKTANGRYECVVCDMEGNFCGLPIDRMTRKNFVEQPTEKED